MRTNAFAVFLTRGEWDGEIPIPDRELRRFHRRIEIIRGADCVVVAYSLEEDGAQGDFPLLHGFVAEEGWDRSDVPLRGEYSIVYPYTTGNGGYLAVRDAVGTRPLFVDKDRSCISSDHRLLSSIGIRPILVPAGATILLERARSAAEASPVVGHPEHPGRTNDRTSGDKMTEPDPDVDIEQAAERLLRHLRLSIARRTRGKRLVAVSFSGGLDSSLVALLAAEGHRVLLCSGSVEGSRDSGVAKPAADALGLELVQTRIRGGDALVQSQKMDLPFDTTPMDKALWVLYTTTARTASNSGAEVLLLGQLADELFGGYMKYSVAARRSAREASEMMRRDVSACTQRSFIRDEMACAQFIEPRFPYADEDVVSFAAELPLSCKITNQDRKAVLRTAARIAGLPKSLAFAPKKAAQYSSGVAKLMGTT